MAFSASAGLRPRLSVKLLGTPWHRYLISFECVINLQWQKSTNGMTG